MPIENEFKFVLNPNTNERIFSHLEKMHIAQGYLFNQDRKSLRLRMELLKDKTIYLMTSKVIVHEECVEINSEISQNDFLKMWTRCNNTLEKTRYSFSEYLWAGITPKEIHWDIDFFKKDRKTYFVMAESEVDDDVRDAPNLIEDVKENLLYTVKQGDERFSSFMISDPVYATQLLRKIKENG